MHRVERRVRALTRTRSSARSATGGFCASLLFILALPACDAARDVDAGTATVAVAANFHVAATELARDFGAAGGANVRLVSGSTGKLYAQIVNGAPFDVYLAADQARPARLEHEGHAVPGSRFTYATGRLSLWSADPALLGGDARSVLGGARYAHLAIANPALAPYGAAAREVLQGLGLWEALSRRLVMGENVGQVYALVRTGNAELGFVALAQLVDGSQPSPGSRWDVPPELHAPIRQDAVLLRRGADNAAARGFLAYLRSAEARAKMAAFGYGSE